MINRRNTLKGGVAAFGAVAMLSCAAIPAQASVSVTPDVVFNGSDAFQTTSFNIPIPSGISTGMFMCVSISMDNTQSGALTITGHTSSTAWTEFTPTASDNKTYIFYKIADSGDAADSATGGLSWVCNCTDGFVECWAGACWSGVDNTTPFATGPTRTNNNPSTITFASQTSPGSTSVWVGLLASPGNNGTPVDPSSPVVKQQTGTSGFFSGEGIVYSATGVTGAFAPTGSVTGGFQWSTVAFFLNPGGSPPPTVHPIRTLIGLGV